MNGFIRIIGGKWRGRKLPVLNNAGIRPTTDRVKETLFNWLMPVIQQANCLDCFAGSGSLGLEAASRGASQVVLLEKNHAAASQIKKNIALLDTTQCQIHNTDTLTWLAKPATKQYDIIFIDPPFNQNLANQTILLLEQNGWLKPEAYIYIETEISCDLNAQRPSDWILHREKQFGQVHSRLFIKQTN
ncbi:16S rRNA (guanine(966)-N(2))-methyltransferase RsmD [Orbaceae bacterium ac157xtp]